jgi:hypothetical protein
MTSCKAERTEPFEQVANDPALVAVACDQLMKSYKPVPAKNSAGQPVPSVQDAIVRFSALGEILDQHVSIRDVQPQLDRRFRAMQTVRDAIAKVQARLESPTLSAGERKALEHELIASRRQLLELQREQTRLLRQTSFATVSIALRSADQAVVVPHDQGRLGRALDRSGSILLDEAKVVVYVLIVGAPLFALLALGLGSLRVRRRRTEARLLSTS